MAGRQAKILTAAHIDDLLFYVQTTRDPIRNRVIVLLSAKAGLRAAEIANLTWDMVRDADGSVGSLLELRDCAAKRKHGRKIPLNADLRDALTQLSERDRGTDAVIESVRGDRLNALSVVMWFSRAFSTLGLEGCSSHSGRRTFITRAARSVEKAGGSLRDVQLLAGHRSLSTTQGYIEGDSEAQRRLISLI